ncbi:MAG: sugar-binding transcriptional regulator [Hyphomicrobiales bacterium]|jgi:DNA-binding transcriptional regulator LsrR (DeoR family)
MPDENTSQLMAQAAWLYYNGGFNQQETAARLGLTRARVNKLLSQARDTGLVSISIDERDLGLLVEEEAIRQAFGLEFCIATPPLGLTDQAGKAMEAISFNMVGAAAAQVLRDQLIEKPDTVIGTGWGRTLERISRNLSGIQAPNAKFVSLMGSLASNSSFNPFEVVHAMAKATGAEGYFLPAPFIADGSEDRDVFLAQRGISEIMQLAGEADLALVSVGELTEASLLRRQGMISAQDLLSLRAAGAVADTNGIFFTSDGSPVPHELNDRVIAVGLDRLSTMKTVLLSAGLEKVPATKALLRSGAVKALIIDGDSASTIYKALG